MKRLLAVTALMVMMSTGVAVADPTMDDPGEWQDAEGNTYQCMEWNDEGCLYARIPVNGGYMEHYVNRQGVRTSRYVQTNSGETDPPEGWH